MQLQEFEALSGELKALGVRVRAVTAQHGDIPNMLKARNCVLDYVALVCDPSFSISQNYIDKGLNLILTTEERPFLLKSATSDGRPHNMVQPAVAIEDASGKMVYTWTWHDLEGKHKWDGTTNGPQVFQRPTPESLIEAMKKGSFADVEMARYPDKWPRKTFNFPPEISFLLRPPFVQEAAPAARL